MPHDDYNMNRRNLYLTDDLWKRVQAAANAKADATGETYSASQFVRDACEAQLKREERKR